MTYDFNMTYLPVFSQQECENIGRAVFVPVILTELNVRRCMILQIEAAVICPNTICLKCSVICLQHWGSSVNGMSRY